MFNVRTSMWKLIKLLSLFNGLKSIMHDLTLDELDELIEEVTVVYERYSDITEARKISNETITG